MRVIKKRNGQSMVETALVLPILLLILTGIIDFGLLFSNYLVVVNASREGARYAAVGYTDMEVNDLVRGVASTLDSTKLSVSIYPAESLRKKGDEVVVTISYDNALFTPIISAIVPNPMELTGRTAMRME